MTMEEELVINRALTVNKIDKIKVRIAAQIQNESKRGVKAAKEEIQELFKTFERLHIALIAKQKASTNDEEHEELHSKVMDAVEAAVDDADDFLFALGEKQLSQDMEKKYEELCAAGDHIIAELKQLETSLSWLKQSKDGDFRAEVSVVGAHIANSDKGLEKMQEIQTLILTQQSSSEKRQEVMKKMSEFKLQIQDLQLRIKSFAARSGATSRQGSRASSPARSNRGVRREDPGGGGNTLPMSESSGGGGFHGFTTEEIIQENRYINTAFGLPSPPERELRRNLEASDKQQPPESRAEPRRRRSASEEPPAPRPRAGSDRGASLPRPSSSTSSNPVFRSKALDYPRFSGDIRDYSTFRRDFNEIISNSGAYFSDNQISLLLRSECLQGKAKALVKNVYNLDELWRKLDDAYDDEGQVVQLIINQITSYKEITENDMAGFVDFVEMIEKAHQDLQAYQSTDVLSNPVTTQAILEKCPYWAQQNITRDMTKMRVSRTMESDFIRLTLIEMKKQARQMSKLSNKKPRNQEGKVKGGKGVVNLAGGREEDAANEAVVGTVNLAATNGASKKGWQCYVPGCKYSSKHMFSQCRAFKAMDPTARGKVVKEKKLCVLCFGGTHDVSTCNKKNTWKPCDKDDCNKWHSRMLHGATTPGLALALPGSRAGNCKSDVLLLLQTIPVAKSSEAVVLWDHGSTTALVTYEYAEKNNLVGEKCNFQLSGVGAECRNYQTKLFTVPLVDKSGVVHHISAFGIEHITSSEVNKNVADATHHFPEVSLEDVKIEGDQVDLLIGLGYADLMPTRTKVVGNLALFESIFGSGKILGGSTGVGDADVAQLASVVAHTQARGVQMDFLSAEAFGVDVPKRCPACKGCKECSFKNSQISYEELTELESIEEKLTLDIEAAKWTTEYSYKQDPSILSDNYAQAFACMTSTTKRLARRGQLDAYDKQFQDNIDRGVFKEVTEEEIKSYQGPVNYITIVEAFKPGPHSTTPLRLCMNSSMKYQGQSLNDIMMKGPSALNDILSVTLGFRSHRVAIVKDISKFYQSVLVGERDQHLRRVLHNPGGKLLKPKVYKTMTVNFGDKIAGCIAQSALRSTANAFKGIDAEAAERIKDDSYVDDTVTGARNLEAARTLSTNMDIIAARGGFIYKETIISGDLDTGEGLRKVLGLGWGAEADNIFIPTKVNFSAKKKGVNEEPDIEQGELEDKTPVEVTRRMVWRVVLGQFDILGLVSVFTIRLKLIMKRLVEECEGVGKKVLWDKPVSPQLRDQFLLLLNMLLKVRSITFPRCVIPAESDEVHLPELLVLVDGSQQAFCALAYLRVRMKDGSYQCRLVMGKTRVAPTKKISVPRMELMGCVTGVRLAQTIIKGLRFELAEILFFTDSSAVLAMIQRPSGSFLEFVGTRVGEIRSKSDPDKWFWIPSNHNLADMGTRDNVEPKDMVEDSQYQRGQPWMSCPREEWPSTQTPGQVPNEELSAAARVNLAVQDVLVSPFNLDRYHTITQAMGVFSNVYVAAQRFKKVPVPVHNASLREKAENFLLHLGQSSARQAFKEGQLDSLRPLKLSSTAFQPVELLVTAGRLGDNMRIGFDKTSLPILMYNSELSGLYMREAHEIDHGGVDRTLQRSRVKVWIVHGRRLAKKIVQKCTECRHRNKKMQGQKMAAVHENRLPPSPVFGSTCLDLFGPIQIKDTVKRRVSKDCYGVIFCCTVTAAIHLEVAEDYSTDAFLMCLKRFINFRGTPFKITSDPGTQLQAAADIIKHWDFERIEGFTKMRKIDWHIIPTNSQHYNGCAESLIKVTKRQLNATLKSRSLTKGELDTLFSDVMHIVNSRPMARGASSDSSSGCPITPNHLLLGRATADVPIMLFDHKASLTKRSTFLETIRKEFWSKWLTQVFPHLVPSHKWRKETPNLEAGDIVLMKKESELSNTYKLAKVKQSMPSDDGLVRKVLLVYKNVDDGPDYKPGGYKDMTTERSIHNLVLIQPINDREDVKKTSPTGNTT